MFDLQNATISENAETVNVSEFRNRIRRIETLVHCDRKQCVGVEELALNLESIRRVSKLLVATTCKRAKTEDWSRRESIIDHATSLIIAAM